MKTTEENTINGQEDMQPDVLNEREFELINIIGEEIGANQRHLSKLMDLSLGMTNMLIRRLIEKGHIRIKQLNKRKVQYILTPKGFAEKTRKSIKYTLKTINSIGLIRRRIENVIKEWYDEGERKFYILGTSDLVALVEMCFQMAHLSDCQVERINELPAESIDGIILICKEDILIAEDYVNHTVDLIQELSTDHTLIQADI